MTLEMKFEMEISKGYVDKVTRTTTILIPASVKKEFEEWKDEGFSVVLKPIIEEDDF